MNRCWTLALGVLVLASAGARADQVYRWKDESGRMHFTNLGPSEPPPAAEEAPPGVKSASISSRRGETPAERSGSASSEKAEEKKSPYADLPDDSFSSTASRKRAELRRDIQSAKDRIRAIDQEIASMRAAREQAFAQLGQQLQGVGAPGTGADPRERDLKEEREAAQKQIESARASYDEIRDEAAKRNGTAPSWLLPVE